MTKRITIQSIRVEELFDQFSYTLDLNTPGNVAVIIGPNGIGKTTVFNLLSFLLDPNIDSFCRIVHIPFRSFQVKMSDGMELILEHVEYDENNTYPDSRVKAAKPAYLQMEDVDDFIFGKPGAWRLIKKQDRRQDQFELGEHTALSRYRSNFTQRNSVYNSYHSFSPRAMCYMDEFCEQVRMILYTYYGSFLKCTPCYDRSFDDLFVRSDRLSERTYYGHDLLSQDASGTRAEQNAKKMQSRASLFKTMNMELKRAVNEALDAYERRMETAHQTLLSCYLSTGVINTVSAERFKREWMAYCEALQQCIDIGFLDEKVAAPEIGDMDEAYAQKGAFLCIYLETFRSALEPLIQEYERWKLLVDIINKRNAITGKRLLLTKDGMKMRLNGRQIDIESLSSGEKNDLVLFYMLLAARGSLVIIDEPEISWHIVWQEEFLDQLLEICRMRGLQAIVATHSPNIINGHFELVAQRSDG